MLIMTLLHVKPSDPPVTVILIMIAVICAAGMMQSCGGLDYLVKIAEKILRKNPKMDNCSGADRCLHFHF